MRHAGLRVLTPALLPAAACAPQPTAVSAPRCRDGLERIEVEDGSTLAGLKLAIQQKLGVPLADMLLSNNAQLVGGQAGAANGRASPQSGFPCSTGCPCGRWPGPGSRGGQLSGREGASISDEPPLRPRRCLPRPPVQLTAKNAAGFSDMLDNSASLRQLGVHHGDMVRAACLASRCATPAPPMRPATASGLAGWLGSAGRCWALPVPPASS